VKKKKKCGGGGTLGRNPLNLRDTYSERKKNDSREVVDIMAKL